MVSSASRAAWAFLDSGSVNGIFHFAIDQEIWFAKNDSRRCRRIGCEGVAFFDGRKFTNRNITKNKQPK